MTQPYQKPWKSHADQVKLLQQRGLVVTDPTAAEQLLAHLNYYRFSGYCLAFEDQQRHTYASGTTFDQVVEAYDFDLVLRDLFTEALEFIEVDVRTAIAHYFGQHHGAFGHTYLKNFHHKFRHQKWHRNLHKEAQRSRELFVTHFRNTYSEFPDLPVWIVTEIMSFGSLSKMYEGMQRNDQKAIAKQYGLQPFVLESWLHHAAYLRNLCAHHSRLWDRIWTIKPTLPTGKYWKPPLVAGNRHLHTSLMILRYWLKQMPAIQSDASEWRDRVALHLDNPPGCNAPHGKMALPANWQKNPLWR